MKILLVASEVAPIIKIGGLGDVIGSLPKALSQNFAVDVDVIVPFFPYANVAGYALYKNIELLVPYNGVTYTVEVYATKLPDSDVDVLLLKNNTFFANPIPHFYADTLTEVEVFAFFSRAVVEYLKLKLNTYDIVHCNDWHTGLITHLLEEEFDTDRPRTLFTIHNILYQGIGSITTPYKVGLTPGMHPALEWNLEDGCVNLMQQGITSSDFINTVSPSYAKEILLPEFAGELSDLLKAREGRLSGILNGIDYTFFPRKYDTLSFSAEKLLVKKALQVKLGLPTTSIAKTIANVSSPTTPTLDMPNPLFSYIGRLDSNQKGLDLLYDALPYLLAHGGQFVLLGKGDPIWEAKFQALAKAYPASVAVTIRFDENLSHEIYAASDFVLIPSKYEPCGLVQMIAMWYGALPVVHKTGGLRDTVTHLVNGLTYENQTPESFSQCLANCFTLYAEPKKMATLITNALNADWSWSSSAEKYMQLYKKMEELNG